MTQAAHGTRRQSGGRNGFGWGICASFTIRNTQVTDAGVKKLQQALPNCKIIY